MQLAVIVYAWSLRKRKSRAGRLWMAENVAVSGDTLGGILNKQVQLVQLAFARCEVRQVNSEVIVNA